MRHSGEVSHDPDPAVYPPVHVAAGHGQPHSQLVHTGHRGGGVPGAPDHPLAPGRHRDDQRGDRPSRPRDARLQAGDHRLHEVPGLPTPVRLSVHHTVVHLLLSGCTAPSAPWGT